MSDLLTPEQIGQRLGRPAEWVMEQARKGTIPGRKIGRFWAFTEQDYADYLDRIRTGTDPWTRSPQSKARRRGAA